MDIAYDVKTHVSALLRTWKRTRHAMTNAPLSALHQSSFSRTIA
jgi:hypothetical protein